MSSIGSLGSSVGGYAGLQRPQPPSKEELFKRADADGSGGVDASELQKVLAHRPGGSSSSTESGSSVDFSKLDSDGSGSLDATEMDAAMRSLMPKPSSTVEFAQQRDVGGPEGMPPGPPPGDGEDTSASSTTYDPLDTNQDGVVSAQERAAGELKEAVQQLLEAADSNGDHSLDASEASSMQDALSQALQSATSTGSASDAGSSASSKQDDALQQQAAKLAQLLVQQYASVSAQGSGVSASTGTQLSVTA